MFVLRSKKAFSDILEGVASKTFSLAPLADLIPFFLLHESVTNCTIYYIVSLKINT